MGPKFWIGDTGKKLRAAGMEAQIVAMYLMTCPHANMIGMFYVSMASIAHETGLGLEGASKGLRSAIEAGFCRYDEPSEVVWVEEMAAYQIARELEPRDNRCKGVQNEYDALPGNPFLSAFYERYGQAFHMTRPRENSQPPAPKQKAPSKPLRSHEQEQEQEQEKKSVAPGSPAAAESPNPLNAETWKAYKAAFVGRYRVEPVRNQKANSLIKQFVQRLGAQAPQVAAFYLTSQRPFHTQKSHALEPMVADAESLHTEWARNSNLKAIPNVQRPAVEAA